MQTKPAIAPQQNPTNDILLVLLKAISVNIHESPPNEAEMFETTNALIALEFIATSLPPLKPNQPNHKRLVPKKMSETFDGL